jgi:hypothetical protein
MNDIHGGGGGGWLVLVVVLNLILIVSAHAGYISITIFATA